jgi:hypothetical protein
MTLPVAAKFLLRDVADRARKIATPTQTPTNMRIVPAGTALAHPLSQHGALPISPLVAAVLATCVVLALSLRNPKHQQLPHARGERFASWTTDLTLPKILTRSLSLALVVLAVAAGRAGSPDELDNLAPALVVGVAWPLLVLASALLGPIWRWLDPWDFVARLQSDEVDGGAGSVGPAVVVAFVWAWYLNAYGSTLEPRSVGATLGLYSIVTVAGCLAFGRAPWLSRAEAFGLFLTWTARSRRRGLLAWRPPRFAELVLGVVAGGLLFGALRASELWGERNVASGAELYALAGVTTSCALCALLLSVLERSSSRRGAPGTVAAGVVPVIAAFAVASALGNNRLFTSLQLLPGLMGDPFGRGWNLFGEAAVGLNPSPLGATGLAVVQVVVLLVGFAAGSSVVSRRADPGGRYPAIIALSLLAAATTIAVTTA